MGVLTDPFVQNAFMQRALLAGILVAIATGVVGTLMVLRGMAFLGDALAHGVLPGIAALPTIDRDEARFVQATRQMLDSADWHGYIVPRFGDQLRLQKPPAIYWVQSASVAALGGVDRGPEAIWMYRLPGAIAAIATALATWWLGLSMFGALTGTLEVGGAGHRTAEVLEERRDEEKRRGLRPGIAFNRQGGAVGGEVDGSVNHDVAIFP